MAHVGGSHVLGKAAAVVVPVAVSTVLTCMVGALLPPVVGAVLFWGGLGCAVALTMGRGEELAVRALYWARTPSAGELAALAPALTVLCRHSLGPPLTRIWVLPLSARWVGAQGAGRSAVLVSEGLLQTVQDRRLPTGQAAAVLAHAAALVRSGRTRSDLLVEFWTTPWQVVHAVVVALGRSVGASVAFAGAWRLRFVVLGLAVVRSACEGPLWVAALLAVILALSYVAPYWERAWQRRLTRIGDALVAEVGLGPDLAQFLSAGRVTAQTRERLAVLRPLVPAAARPVLVEP